MPLQQHNLSDELNELLDCLSEQIFVVRYYWATYLALYSDATTVEILDSVAPIVSSMQEQSRGYILISLARLFDPVNPKQDNLTFHSIVEKIREHTDQSFVSQIEEAIKEAALQAEPIRQERHKRIAHLDAKTMLIKNKRWDMPHEQIENLLCKIEAIFNQIDFHLRGATHCHQVYANNANAQVARFVEKLSVILAMDESELNDKISQLDIPNNIAEQPNCP